MKPHIITVQWATKCTTCPLVLHKGDRQYIDATHAYCMDCYTEREHCIACDKDIEHQAHNYIRKHKNYCWDCAMADAVDHHFNTYTTAEWR
jgi:hypothetical protein